MGLLKTLGEKSKHVGEILGVLAIVLPLAFWVAQPRIDEYIGARSTVIGGPCVTFPASGHRAFDGMPGDWTQIHWNDLVKLRDDCGTPHVTGVITNGGGLYHDAPLSISGVLVPLGPFNMKYAFYIDERVEDGAGRFRVTVTYPEAIHGAPPAISPWVPFDIIPSEEETTIFPE